MYIPAPTESNFAPCPAGTHLGLCYRVIDLGTQVSNFDGETKTAHKIMLSWEIPEEKMEDGRPFMISKTFTWSMHEKATLRKWLEAWRALAFSERDFGPGGFDIKNVLGKACTLSIVHTQKNDKIYANVSSLGKVMKGVTVPHLTNPTSYLWLNQERWDAAVFSQLSAPWQAKIMSSPEYMELMKHNDAPRDDGEFHGDENIPF